MFYHFILYDNLSNKMHSISTLVAFQSVELFHKFLNRKLIIFLLMIYTPNLLAYVYLDSLVIKDCELLSIYESFKTLNDPDCLFDQSLVFHLDSIYNNSNKIRCRVAAADFLGQYYMYENKSNQAFRYFKDAIEISNELKNNDLVRGNIHANFADFLGEHQIYRLQIKHLKIALESLTQLDKENGFQTGYLYNDIAEAYYTTGMIDSALYYENEMIKKAERVSSTYWLCTLLNNIGIMAHGREEYNKALSCFDRALDLIKKKRNRDEKYNHANIEESKAHTQIKLGNIEQGINVLKKVFIERKQLKYYSEAIQTFNYILSYSLRHKGLDEAYNFYRTELPYLKSEKILDRHTIKIYKTIGDILTQKNLHVESKEYMFIYNEYWANKMKEKEFQKRNRENINSLITLRNINFEQKIAIQKLEKEKLEKEIRTKNFLIFLIIGLFIFVLLVAQIIYRFDKKEKKRKVESELQAKRILELENKTLKIKIQLKEKDIKKIAADNKIRTGTKKEVLEKISAIEYLPYDKMQKAIFVLISDLKQAINDQSELSLLQDNLETINMAFEDSLKSYFPGINSQEIKLCSMIKLGMNNSEIARRLNKATSTIRSYKFRLKIKGNLNSIKEMEDLILQA